MSAGCAGFILSLLLAESLGPRVVDGLHALYAEGLSAFLEGDKFAYLFNIIGASGNPGTFGSFSNSLAGFLSAAIVADHLLTPNIQDLNPAHLHTYRDIPGGYPRTKATPPSQNLDPQRPVTSNHRPPPVGGLRLAMPIPPALRHQVAESSALLHSYLRTAADWVRINLFLSQPAVPRRMIPRPEEEHGYQSKPWRQSVPPTSPGRPAHSPVVTNVPQVAHYMTPGRRSVPPTTASKRVPRYPIGEVTLTLNEGLVPLANLLAKTELDFGYRP